jgi:hypothetical protein
MKNLHPMKNYKVTNTNSSMYEKPTHIFISCLSRTVFLFLFLVTVHEYTLFACVSQPGVELRHCYCVVLCCVFCVMLFCVVLLC